MVTSWLLDLTAAALAEEGDLACYSGHVADSGEGRWTIQAAIEEAVPADVLSAALYARFRSRQEHTFAEKMLSAMRKGFGGHQRARQVMSADSEAVARHRGDGRVGLPASPRSAGCRRAARLAVPRCRQLSSAGQHREDEQGRAADR